MIASSISSPPTRSDCETTMPPSEITATSVVPPPMSTIRLPVGSDTGRPAPIAAPLRPPVRCAPAGRGGHGLCDQVRLAGAGGDGGLLHGTLLDAGDSGRDADHHARVRPAV